MPLPNRAERRKRKSCQRRAIKDAIKRLRALRSAHNKLTRQGAPDAQVPTSSSEAPQGEKELQEEIGEEVQRRFRNALGELA